MSGTFGKMAPTAIVFGLVAWCCWPYLAGPPSATGVQPKADLPRIAGVLLSPEVEPAPNRNPFQPPPAREPDPPASEEPGARPPEPGGQEKAVAEKDPVDVLSGLVLGAIYIRGDRRVALINGQLCQQGQLT